MFFLGGGGRHSDIKQESTRYRTVRYRTTYVYPRMQKISFVWKFHMPIIKDESACGGELLH